MLISYLILYYPVWANIQYEKKIPLITAHRGSMWYFPEHTLMAYYYAFFEKSDFIDVDLQPTKDGKFVVYHDPILQEHEVEGLQSFDQTMKIKEPFVNNISKRVYNNGWYVKDFDSEFITSKLMHKMRYGVDQQNLPEGSDYGTRPGFFDAKLPLITLETAIEYVMDLNKKYAHVNKMGLNLELKCAQQYLDDYNIDVTKILRETLLKYQIESKLKSSQKLPIIIQSYDVFALSQFKKFDDAFPTTLLINWPIMPHQKSWTADHIKNLGFVDIIGPDWVYLNSKHRKSKNYEEIKEDLHSIGFMSDKDKLITETFHEVGIMVHPYVAKDDFPRYTDSDPVEEYEFYFNTLMIDGIFSENPLTAILARDYLKNKASAGKTDKVYYREKDEFIQN